jgi:tellurite resistance protein
MSNRYSRNSLGVSKAEVMAAWQKGRDDELLDAVVSAAALVARADGKADAVERAQTAYFLARYGRLATVTRADILDAFDHRLRHLRELGGTETAVESLRRNAGCAPARLIIETAEHIAAADGHFRPEEMHALRSIRKALRAPPRPQIA